MAEQWRYSQRALRMKSSIIREILKIAQKPGVISFGGGLPAPELFPVEEIREAANRMMKEKGREALQYGLTAGYPPLKEFLAQRLQRQGIDVTEENILITGGSQQGLDLAGKVFLDLDSPVLLGRPTYLAAIQAFNAYHAVYITIPLDDKGIQVEKMEEEIKRHEPRFIYVIPNFQNPAGVTLSLERRKKLIELSRKYQVPIIEDDPYGELYYEGEPLPSLRALGGDQVITLSTFSKLLAPGMRVAWLVAGVEVLKQFIKMKQGSDLHTNAFAQYVIYEYIKDGALDQHIHVLRREYGKRREVMLAALEEHFPPEVHWTKPQGGLFLWVTLPKGVNATEILPTAVERGVAYVPGQPFFADDDGENTLRLNFSNAKPEMIKEGIKKLGQVFREKIG